MIKFFRKIRRLLLIEKKFNKYLLYAIGEIVLIVFGVLIALSINNWNQERILKNLESKLLYDIIDNLKASRTNLIASISYNKKTIINHEKILRYVKEDLPYSPSLDTAFSYFSYWSEPNFTYTTYETIKTKGLDIIQNDSLKDLIAETYEEYFPFLIDELNGEWELYTSLVLPFIEKNIQYINSDVARPNNFIDLKTNMQFQNLMGLKMIIRNNSIQTSEMTLEKVNSLIFMIERELNKLSAKGNRRKSDY